MDDLIFESPAETPNGGAAGSKWFIYSGTVEYEDATGYSGTYIATTRANIGGGVENSTLETTYDNEKGTANGKGKFVHGGDLKKKYAPNFLP
jgi:hypothetical protein